MGGLRGDLLMKIELPLKTPITVFVQIVGLNGKVRELQAVLDTGSVYTLIYWKDAIQLGYGAVYESGLGVAEGVGVRAITPAILIDVPLISLKEVKVGGLTATNVEAVVYNLPEMSGIDVLLGISFLKNFNITINYARGVLIIESF